MPGVGVGVRSKELVAVERPGPERRFRKGEASSAQVLRRGDAGQTHPLELICENPCPTGGKEVREPPCAEKRLGAFFPHRFSPRHGCSSFLFFVLPDLGLNIAAACRLHIL